MSILKKISDTAYSFSADFECLNEKHLPYGVSVERSSSYAHDHVRTEDKMFYITCGGNKYFLNTPNMRNCRIKCKFGFHNNDDKSGAYLFFRYDRTLYTGYSLEIELKRNGEMILSLYRLNSVKKEKLSAVKFDNTDFPDNGNYAEADVEVSEKLVRGTVCGNSFEMAFTECEQNLSGQTGFSFMPSLGEMVLRSFSAENDGEWEFSDILPEKTVTIPMRNGGNIPYTLTYSIVSCMGRSYLRYSLSGGAQEREHDPSYPRITGQYSVENDRIWSPFVAVYSGNENIPLAERFMKNGMFMVSDPGLHWKDILGPYFGLIILPLNGTLELPSVSNIDELQISFGYLKRLTRGYYMQTEENVEFIYGASSGELLYEGLSRGTEGIIVTSPFDKNAVGLIPENACEYDIAVKHMQNNNYFDETENIRFSVHVQTSKSSRFLILKAELQDVYGDFIRNFDVKSVKSGDFACECSPLDIGVYRAVFSVSSGGTPFMNKEVVFEVYDREGKICAPLASGLPFLYSMPNEQRYLDRDAFDPWNPCPNCDMEHYYACTSFAGDIAVKRRTWEVARKFAREWYVWLSPHRTITQEEFELYHDIIAANGDYIYYPVKYEWAVMRHDYFLSHTYAYTGLLNYLRDFISLHPEYDIGLSPDDNTISEEQLDKLMNLALSQWVDYANDRVLESIREDNALLKKQFPNFKRACYGPMPIYVIPMATHNIMRYYGYKPDSSLAEDVFDGFCQLEDYPFSCSYHTYRGAFAVMNLNLHIPKLCIYPEQYTASYGGCIDGAVKDANPPLGKYDMPEYFNVTHSYEYAFNTAYLSEDGFGYWKSFGFMQRDFAPPFAESLIRGWKNVLRNKPMQPCRTTSYLSEIPACDDRYERFNGSSNIYNISEVGLGYVYETSRLSGIPSGFALKWESLERLDSANTDLLILPSLNGAPEKALDKIRELYESGVSLLAVSEVCGLEDLFGVVPKRIKSTINLLKDSENSEHILPEEAEFVYDIKDAEIELYAADIDGVTENAAVIRKDRAVLINSPLTNLGRSFYRSASPYPENISTLMRRTIGRLLRKLSSPYAVADSCGITVFKNRNGETLLLAIDYSDYDPSSITVPKESEIILNDGSYTGIEVLYGQTPNCIYENGVLKGMYLNLCYEECALIKLKS